MHSLIWQHQNTFIHRLEMKGIRRQQIPGFLRLLADLFSGDPAMDLLALNRHLHYLGWDDVELDYHTLQLAIACFEADGFDSIAAPTPSPFICNTNRVNISVQSIDGL